jgi:DNA-directed RNA polymerase specialized sigma24 family protein
MKIPDNMTQEETLQQINIVVNRISQRYVFGSYTLDDIKQEAFIMCMDALNRYDSTRSLENFLSVHLSNRLKNFVRDNYYLKDEEEKKRILNPARLCETESLKYIQSYSENLEAKNIKQIVDKYLPAEYRADYLKMVNDIYVPKKKKNEIILIIKNLIKEHINEEG